MVFEPLQWDAGDPGSSLSSSTDSLNSRGHIPLGFHHICTIDLIFLPLASMSCKLPGEGTMSHCAQHPSAYPQEDPSCSANKPLPGGVLSGSFLGHSVPAAAPARAAHSQ